MEEQRIINSITYGHGQMPSFGKKLSKAQIKLLLYFCSHFQGLTPVDRVDGPFTIRRSAAGVALIVISLKCYEVALLRRI